MKGIILAGGSGSRLNPLTKVISKQLLPVYDKPMIYYPLSILMEAGIREILIISTPDDTPKFMKLLGNGGSLGLKLDYKIQPRPEGLAQAFILGESFLDNQSACMILGDNIFYDKTLKERLKNIVKKDEGATIFGYKVADPRRFGVIEFDDNNKVISIEEKPVKPKSNYCVTGLYFYDNKVVEYAKKLKPSKRNELEITDLNNMYLKENKLNIEMLSAEATWLDTGTIDSLFSASEFIKKQEEITNDKIGCLEEIAYKNGWISKLQLNNLITNMGVSEYRIYLEKILMGDKQK